MPAPVVVTARPIGARWHVEIPDRTAIETRTLKTAEAMAGRSVGGPIDLQVGLGGLEDLCADAVELGEQSDALAVEAMRSRRFAAQGLGAAGIRTADVGYLMGIAQDSVKHLLNVPIDTPWMSGAQAPPTPLRRAVQSGAPGTTRDVVPVVVTRHGTGWHVHVNPGRRPVGRTSLVRAEMLVYHLVADADVLLCPQLPAELEHLVRAADIATADAEDHQHQAHDLRLDLARRLRELEIGYQDIGHLLEIHEHRLRLRSASRPKTQRSTA